MGYFHMDEVIWNNSTSQFMIAFEVELFRIIPPLNKWSYYKKLYQGNLKKKKN